MSSILLLMITALLISLTSCSASGPDATEKSREESPSAGEPTEAPAAETATPPPEDEGDLMAVCDGLFGGDDPLAERVPELIINLPADLDEEEAQVYLDVNTEFHALRRQAPDSMDDDLATMQGMFSDIAEMIFGGGGPMSSDTSGVAEAVVDLMGQCGEADWRFDG